MLLAALMVHGITPGPLFIKEQPVVFWGLIASMYVGNLVLLLLNLPLVGIFVNLLRVPCRILYPTILLFCVVGVYAVNSSMVDVGDHDDSAWYAVSWVVCLAYVVSN